MEGAEKRSQRLCDDLPKCEPTAARVHTEGMHNAQREFERDRHHRLDRGHRSTQCRGLLEIAIRLPSRQRKLVGQLLGRIGGVDLLSEETVRRVQQPRFVRFGRSRHVT